MLETLSGVGAEFDASMGTVVGTLDTKGIIRDMERIYHQGRTGRSADGVRPKNLNTAKIDGYSSADSLRGLAAEAFRAYIENPGWIKANYPKVAERLRRHVNTGPKIRDWVQLNTAMPVALAAGALAASDGSDAALAKPNMAAIASGFSSVVGGAAEWIRESSAGALLDPFESTAGVLESRSDREAPDALDAAFTLMEVLGPTSYELLKIRDDEIDDDDPMAHDKRCRRENRQACQDRA